MLLYVGLLLGFTSDIFAHFDIRCALTYKVLLDLIVIHVLKLKDMKGMEKYIADYACPWATLKISTMEHRALGETDSLLDQPLSRNRVKKSTFFFSMHLASLRLSFVLV